MTGVELIYNLVLKALSESLEVIGWPMESAFFFM